MKNRKVCILSMQRVQNLGSLLQSYALKRMLETQGCEVSFLDIEKREDDNVLLHGKTDDFATEMEASGGILAKLKKVDRYTVNRIKIRKLADCQDRYFEEFREKILNICQGDNEKHYDLCVIGSDEVFNCLTPSNWGFTTQLFGNVPQADSVITYAASCGATKIANLNEDTKEAIRNSFQHVSGFSVRDENTREFVEQLTDEKTILNHCDPVWCWNFEEEISRESLPDNLPSKYCVIYSYYNRIHNPEEIQTIRSFCKEKGLTPIAVGAPQMWLKNYAVGSVFQLLKVFENAEFVITDTFHGTILSEKLNGRYAVLLRDSNRNKLGDLLRRIHAEKHLISDFTELNAVYEYVSPRNLSVAYQMEAKKQAIKYLGDHVKKQDGEKK